MNFDFVKYFNRYQVWLKPEALEQARLVMWLEDNNYKFTSIPNSTWTKSYKQKIVNFLTGVRPGLCDLVIVLKRKSLLFIELKLPRAKLLNGTLGASPSKISPEQKEWIKILGDIDNVHAQVCYGCEEAKILVADMERLDTPKQ